VLHAQQQRIDVMQRASAAAVAIFAGEAGGGSGVLISPDGYALTNFHVVQPAGVAMKCGLADGRLYDAVLVGLDPTGDVALVKLLGRDDFPFAEFANSDEVEVGDFCFAAGNPFLLATDFQPSISAGIVSGTIALWQTWHGGAYNWFTGGAETLFCPWGSNAVTWDMREPATPKMAGIVAVASTPPAPITSGLPLPLVNHPWSDYIGSYTPNCSVSPPRSPYPQSIGANRSISYLLYVPDPTTCRLKVSLAMCGRGSAAGTNFMRFSIAAWMAPIDFPAPQSPAGCSQYAPVERTFPPLSGPRFTGNPHITLVFTNVFQPGTYEMTTFNASCA
jgi:hypothetical protein